MGRLGVWLQVTADMGNVGQLSHSWTLEIRVVQPVRLYPQMSIGQVMFWTSYGTLKQYQGEYHHFNQPHQSLLYSEGES